MNKKKLSEPLIPPQTYHFASVLGLMSEAATHAREKRQIAIRYDDLEQKWEMTVFGLKF